MQSVRLSHNVAAPDDHARQPEKQIINRAPHDSIGGLDTILAEIQSSEKSIQSWHRSLVVFHHLINLVARASTSGGIVRPICFAVFKLITNSNFVGCST